MRTMRRIWRKRRLRSAEVAKILPWLPAETTATEAMSTMMSVEWKGDRNGLHIPKCEQQDIFIQPVRPDGMFHTSMGYIWHVHLGNSPHRAPNEAWKVIGWMFCLSHSKQISSPILHTLAFITTRQHLQLLPLFHYRTLIGPVIFWPGNSETDGSLSMRICEISDFKSRISSSLANLFFNSTRPLYVGPLSYLTFFS